MRIIGRYGFSVALSLLVSGCGNDCVTGDSTIGFPEAQRAEMGTMAPWAKHARTCRIAGYTVIGPVDGSSGEILVTRDGTNIVLDSPRQIHVQSAKGSLVNIQDIEGAGKFDWISYSIVDPLDGLKYDVIDADADGRLDTKVGDKVGFVNINGQWAALEKHADQQGAVVAGKWQPLEKHGRVWQLQTK